MATAYYDKNHHCPNQQHQVDAIILHVHTSYLMRTQAFKTVDQVNRGPVWARARTHAMATLLPSMMMCLRSGEPGSLASFRV